MSQTPRLLLIAPPTMTRTPAFDRAAALARAMQLPLHIVAFNYLQALAIAGLFAPEQINRAREGYLDTHRHWLTEQAVSMSKHGIEVTSEVDFGARLEVSIFRSVSTPLMILPLASTP